jgi:phosphate/sulfate permease
LHAALQSGIIGQAWAQDRQFKLLCWTGAAAFAVGLLLSPIIAGFLPFGLNARVAALVMRQDQWTAGSDLMRGGNPRAWERFNADAATLSDNREAIDACRAALARTGKSQRCVVTLTPSEVSGPKPQAEHKN